VKKIDIIDYSDWFPYEGFAEGSGRSEKLWLQSPTGEIGLFKYPKVDPDTSEVTTEYVSEHLAHKIGELLGIETAHVEIGIFKNRIGCMSYLINKQEEAIIEGETFITGKHPDYDSYSMMETSTGRYYCLDHLLEVSNSQIVINGWIRMMLFDFLIGNSDRHQNNWAILVKYTDDEKNSLFGRVCPFYDNGSSLCCYINEKSVLDYLGKDTNRFDALTDSKSRSMIRIDGQSKKRPTHYEVVHELINRYPEAMEFSKIITSRMTEEVIENLVDAYRDILSDNKIELIKKFLIRKVNLLERVLGRKEHG